MPLDLLPDATQQAIVEAAASLLDANDAVTQLRASTTGQVRSDGIWSKVADQGWFSLGVPGELGGLGLGLAEQHLVLRAVGETLTPGPFLGTMLAADVAVASRPDFLEQIVTGTPVGLLVSKVDPASEVGGRIEFHTDDAEDGLCWLALTPAGAWLVDCLDVDPLPPSLDLGARPGRAFLAVPDAGYAPGAKWWTRAAVLVASELAGIAAAATKASVHYTRTREQFGRPIGSFQMVQQRMADMATRGDAATQLTALAALAVQADQQGATQLAASSLHVAAQAAVHNARDDIQNHGGLGYTWEVDCHLRLRRAHGLQYRLGGSGLLRSAILEGSSARPW